MFEELERDLQVYRKTTPTDFVDPTWVLITTIKGRIDPVVGFASYVNNQNFQGATDNAFLSNMTYEGVVLPSDGIIDIWGNEYVVVGYPEVWRSILPYIMLKLERRQFTVGP